MYDRNSTRKYALKPFKCKNNDKLIDELKMLKIFR